MTAISWLAFSRQGVLLDPLLPSLSSGAVFLVGILALYNHKRRQVGEIRSASTPANAASAIWVRRGGSTIPPSAMK
jgi:hypothetical protein